jgi:hypothetical protein
MEPPNTYIMECQISHTGSHQKQQAKSGSSLSAYTPKTAQPRCTAAGILKDSVQRITILPSVATLSCSRLPCQASAAAASAAALLGCLLLLSLSAGCHLLGGVQRLS